MKPEVSVIIPTFNRASILPRAIASVLAQTGVFFELIVVDDGSTDGTAGLIQRDFPSVNYFYQENQGPSAARNRGIERSHGEWIAFLDSDDEWLPGKLQAQLAFFNQHPDYKIMQTEEIWVRNGKRVNPMNKHKKYGGFIFDKCLPLCAVSPSAVMIHKSLFEEIGLFDESLPACEDYDLWLRIAARHAIGLLEKPFITRYGGHADQCSRKYPAMDLFRIRALVKILRSETLTPEQSESAEKTLKEKSEIYIQGAMKRGKTREAEEIRGIIHETLQTL